MHEVIDTNMTDQPHNVRDDILAYEQVKSELEAAYIGKWVVFHASKFEGAFDSFDEAAKEAVSRFGAGPYLIRRVGAHSVSLPASVMYGPFHGIDTLRI